MNKVQVSIIIPTYNEESVIRECLESLSRQIFKSVEIIIVDDGSTDNTKNIIQNLKFKILNLKLLKQMHLGPGAARNLGAKQAKGEILVFVDSDMTFHESFIGNLIEPIQSGKFQGTFSKLEYVKNPENVWSRSWGINQNWESGARHPRGYLDTQKVFRAILKSEFDRVGGFDLTGYTDDWTLSEKLGYKAVAVNAIFYHKNPESLTEVYKHAVWIGKRKYKLGWIGNIVTLLRSSMLISLCIGLYKSIIYIEPLFVIFKIVYDLGIFSGAIKSLFRGENAK